MKKIKNSYAVKTGDVVLIYTEQRGKLYVVLGATEDKSHLVLLNNNVIRKDGELADLRNHIKYAPLTYSEVEPMVLVTKKIKRVVTSRSFNIKTDLSKIIQQFGNVIILKPKTEGVEIKYNNIPNYRVTNEF